MNYPAPDSLAIFGGEPVICSPFPPYKSLGEEEILAANRAGVQTVLKRIFAIALGRFGTGACAPGQQSRGSNSVRFQEITTI